MVERQLETRVSRTRAWVGALLAAGLLAGTLPAWATGSNGPDEAMLDATALALMEQRADQAKPQEQCFLYTQVLHGLTEAAGRAMAAGDEEQVATTMAKMDAVMHKIQTVSANNAKRLKNAEELMEHSQHRLSDMAHVATSGERSAVQTTLSELDRLHAKVLALVFSR